MHVCHVYPRRTESHSNTPTAEQGNHTICAKTLSRTVAPRQVEPGATADPNVLINRATAVRDIPVGRVWITKAFWGLTTTLDRQLEESLTHGPDPLHLAAVFGISPGTAIRYAAAARQLRTTPAELHQAP